MKPSYWDECALPGCGRIFWNLYGEARFCSKGHARGMDHLNRRPERLAAEAALAKAIAAMTIK